MLRRGDFSLMRLIPGVEGQVNQKKDARLVVLEKTLNLPSRSKHGVSEFRHMDHARGSRAVEARYLTLHTVRLFLGEFFPATAEMAVTASPLDLRGTRPRGSAAGEPAP